MQNSLKNTISLNTKVKTLGIRKTASLSTVKKYKESYNKITWKSSNEKIVTIIATTYSGISTSFELNVSDTVSDSYYVVVAKAMGKDYL